MPSVLFGIFECISQKEWTKALAEVHSVENYFALSILYHGMRNLCDGNVAVFKNTATNCLAQEKSWGWKWMCVSPLEKETAFDSELPTVKPRFAKCEVSRCVVLCCVVLCVCVCLLAFGLSTSKETDMTQDRKHRNELNSSKLTGKHESKGQRILSDDDFSHEVAEGREFHLTGLTNKQSSRTARAKSPSQRSRKYQVGKA